MLNEFLVVFYFITHLCQRMYSTKTPIQVFYSNLMIFLFHVSINFSLSVYVFTIPVDTFLKPHPLTH